MNTNTWIKPDYCNNKNVDCSECEQYKSITGTYKICILMETIKPRVIRISKEESVAQQAVGR
jgi:hypothetical protein